MGVEKRKDFATLSTPCLESREGPALRQSLHVGVLPGEGAANRPEPPDLLIIETLT